MHPRKLSKRMMASTALVASGTACTAFALLLPPWSYAIVPLFFLGITLMGAGALCPFRRTIYGTAAGFVFAVYLSTPVARVTDTPASETFKSVAAELNLPAE